MDAEPWQRSDTLLRVTFDHEHWPGLTLIRDVAVFDELGRPAQGTMTNLGWTFAETLDGGLAPPAGATGSVLYV